MSGSARAAGSTLSPLAHPLFRTLLIALFAANAGNMIFAVGVQWQMTAMQAGADRIALVWTAMSLPMLFLSIVGGAFADRHDPRRIFLFVYGGSAAVSALLAWLTLQGLATPWLLVAATFALGIGTAFHTPAGQASLALVVPVEELAGGASLAILGFNVARTIGPAAGGAIVALGGAPAAFLANVLAFLVAIIFLSRWRPPRRERSGPAGSIAAAVVEGLGSVRDRPPLRAVVGRALAFTLTGSAVWALMPLVARDLLGGGPGQFGLLLGALGLGAVLGAALSHEFRRRFAGEHIVRIAALVYGGACLVVATAPGLAISFAALVVGGAGWVQGLSGFSVAGQLWAPRHAVGRVTATVSTVTFGGIALGSWLWGHVAAIWGIAAAIGGSGAAMLLVAALGFLLPMPGSPNVAES